MRLPGKAPSIPLFTLFPVWMGSEWVWLERIDAVFDVVMGMPVIKLRTRGRQCLTEAERERAQSLTSSRCNR